MYVYTNNVVLMYIPSPQAHYFLLSFKLLQFVNTSIFASCLNQKGLKGQIFNRAQYLHF